MAEDSIICPHCEQNSRRDSWPFCSYCRLFVIEEGELDLSPRASITIWRKEVALSYVH